MKKLLRSALGSGLLGLSAGLGFFVLEISFRLVYLYFWTFEKAPIDYGQVMVLYAICGLLASAGFFSLRAVLRAAGKRTGLSFRAALGVSIALLLPLATVLFMRMVEAKGFNLGQALGHLGVVSLGCAAFALLAWFSVRLKRRFGAARFAAWYGLVLVLLVFTHLIFLRSFSLERVLARLPESERSGVGPNVLLLTIDTLRADRLGVYGSPKRLTPNMDRLAAEGALFQRAISQSPWTRPSYGSMLTSLYPSQHGAFIINKLAESATDWKLAQSSGLRDEVLTMAEIFSKRSRFAPWPGRYGD